MSHIAVVGAGLGGIATAVRLAAAGHRVTLFEKNSAPGGKVGLIEEKGFRFEAGPPFFTLPGVVADTFRAAGRPVEDYLTLKALEPVARCRFSDGSSLDLSSNLPRLVAEVGNLSPADVARLFRFLAYSRTQFERMGPVFLLHERPRLRDLLVRRALDMLRIDARLTMHRVVRRSFRDPRLVQLFDYYATYAGSSPYRAPSTLAMLPYIELAGGAWYVEGGLYRLVEALMEVGHELGVNFQPGCEIGEIIVEARGGKRPAATGVRIAQGGTVFADAVVVNADPMYAYPALVPEEFQDRGLARRMQRFEPSGSAFLLLLGVSGDYPELAHHNIFFSREHRAEYRTVFDWGEPAPNPTLRVTCTARSDPTHAPADHLNLVVQANAPAIMEGADWRTWRRPYRNAVLSRLEAAGLPGLRRRIVFERTITPLDFEQRYHSWLGAVYGLASHGRRQESQRPPHRAPSPDNLFFAGGCVHPGGGIAQVLLSARLVARLIK